MVTYSTGLRTELQVTGENSGTWGTITNNNFSQVFEFAIAGVYDVPAITTGTSTTHTVQFPATQKTYGIYNNITGGADISARLGAGGNTLTITNGKYRLVSTDGTDWYDILSLAGLDETWTLVADGTTLTAGQNAFANTNAGTITYTLPLSPSIGDQCKVVDLGNAATNNITINRNSQPIQGLDANMTISTDSAAISLVYSNATYGWRLKYND